MNTIHYKFLLLFVLFIGNLSSPLGASDSKLKFLVPDKLNIQYAGNIGLVSMGAGYNFFHNRFASSVVYGYLPKSVNQASVHTFAMKSSIYFKERSIGCKLKTQNYLGINIFHSYTSKTYLKYPSYFPNNYYESNAIHLAPYIGNRVSIPVNGDSIIESWGIYAELGTLDQYIWNDATTKTIGPFDIWNFCFGFFVELQ